MHDYHPQIHELKTWPEYYEYICNDSKAFELRKNDRDYAMDDLLLLREWYPDSQEYSGRVTVAVVTCVVRGEWLANGYVALGIRVLR